VIISLGLVAVITGEITYCMLHLQSTLGFAFLMQSCNVLKMTCTEHQLENQTIIKRFYLEEFTRILCKRKVVVGSESDSKAFAEIQQSA